MKLSPGGNRAPGGVAGVLAGAVLLCLVVLFPPPAAASSDNALDRLDAWLDANQSFRAGFIQTVFDEDGVRLSESGGTVSFRRPFRFRWDYVVPAPQLIIADGVTLWWYDVELEQATAQPVRAALEGTPSVLLGGTGRIRDHFAVTGVQSGDGVDWIELVPRDTEAAFRGIRVGLAGRGLRAVEMKDGFGQTTRIEFFDVERNPDLADELFLFSLPSGVDVIRTD